MGITAKDVRDVAFSRPPFGKRGYNEAQVDALLDQLETELIARESGSGAGVSGAFVRETRFGTPPIGKRGYNEDEVDRFLDQAATELDNLPPTAVPVDAPAARSTAETVLFASPATLQRVVDMITAESDLLAQWPAAAEARTKPPSLTIYTVS
ncbi:DivIVA domain-containing protein [Mycobacterium sp. CBMA271]|uniref:DivIVA domain-containing protein n=1 Tax=unclassified Mycobacteroides TaxID=2618759 RepID=UPI0012DE603F|nr:MULTISPECIES: DivIVA domain-containing protein [unclassified Mycobacteroides]MUM15712.1 hypothetical protein [Mycobacteroides sp. CBMA 326]MUM17507.1 hypothetical protein [Mycobacteroides sp. CBMA 326]MUM21984.1 DivIVA domain-containing protein [Mycobacteroides sp. CBMA 271]